MFYLYFRKQIQSNKQAQTVNFLILPKRFAKVDVSIVEK